MKLTDRYLVKREAAKVEKEEEAAKTRNRHIYATQ